MENGETRITSATGEFTVKFVKAMRRAEAALNAIVVKTMIIRIKDFNWVINTRLLTSGMSKRARNQSGCNPSLLNDVCDHVLKVPNTNSIKKSFVRMHQYSGGSFKRSQECPQGLRTTEQTGVLLEFVENKLIGFQQLDLDYDSASDSIDNWCVPALSRHEIAMQNQSNRKNTLIILNWNPIKVEQFWLGNITKIFTIRHIELLCSRVIQ